MMVTDCREDIAYGSYIINRPPFFVDSINVYSAPNLAVSRLARLTRPGSIISQSRIEEKIVELTGRIVPEKRSRQTILTHIDRFKTALLNTELPILSVGYPDGRSYRGVQVVGEIEVAWEEASYNSIPWTVQFLCPNPLLTHNILQFVTDNDPLTLVSGSEYRKILTIEPGGTAFSYLRFLITIPSGSSFGISSIKIVNTTVEGDPQIVVQETYLADDQLLIAGEELVVSINDVPTDFEGQFIPADRRAGSTNTIEIWATATSTPTLNVAVTWRPRWF